MRALGEVAAKLVPNPDEVLYFSSPVERCIESLRHFHRGFPRSLGNPPDINTRNVPSLDYNYTYGSHYVRARPHMTNRDFKNDYGYRGQQLMDVLQSRYGISNLSTEAFNLWQTIECERQLPKETYLLASHYSWIYGSDFEFIPNSDRLYEFFAFAAAAGYYHQLDDYAHYLSTSPILTSIMDSMNGHRGYANKKLIVYMSHDSVLDMFLRDLDISKPAHECAQKCESESCPKHAQPVLCRRALPNFGFTARFELWRLEATHSHVVRLKIYNKKSFFDQSDINEDSFERVELGKMCRSKYYATYGIDRMREDPDTENVFDCPLRMFRYFVASWMLDESLFRKIYDNRIEDV